MRFRCYSLQAELSALFHQGFLSRPIEDFNVSKLVFYAQSTGMVLSEQDFNDSVHKKTM